MSRTRPVVRRSGPGVLGRRATVRRWCVASVLAVLCVVWGGLRAARAAPEAHILRIDPRASMTEGVPVLTTVVELVEHKRMSDISSRCAMQTGDAQLDCLANLLEQPGALYTPFDFPAKNALLTVTVDGADLPATFVSSARWGESSGSPGVGTAWLVLVDASASMASRFREAQAVAKGFIDAMGPADVVDVMFFDDRAVVADSRWLADKAAAHTFVDASGRTYPAQGRTRPLFSIIKTAATDAFKELGNVGTAFEVPMHQSLVVLSSGWAGGDTGSVGPAALALSDYLTRGRFPEDNATLPKTPVPVVSIWFPSRQIEEFYQSSRQFMENLANPSIGGFYSIIREGQSVRAPRVVQSVRARFDQMHIVRWRVSCVAPTVSQTFKLLFRALDPPVAGDNFIDVPVGIDPTLWPLDVDVARTVAYAKKHRVHPGGTVKIFGSFCWGSDEKRAQLYLVPKGQQLPAALRSNDVEQARDAQRKLTESNLVAKASESGDTFVEFELPSSAKFLAGKGSKMVARMVVYDTKARRASAVAANAILTLPAREKPLDLWLVGGLTFVGVVLLLLVIPVLRGGSKQGRGAVERPAPIVAAGAAPAAPVAPGPGPAWGEPAPAGHGAGGAPAGWPPTSAAGAPAAGVGAAHAPFGAAVVDALPAPPGGGRESAPPGHGFAAQAVGAAADVRVAPMASRVSRAILSGPAGVYPITAGADLRVGRDPGISDICLTEPRVSAQHALVRLEAGQLLVRDEGSNNGTFVSGFRIGAGIWTAVPHGTQLKFGPIEFTVRLE